MSGMFKKLIIIGNGFDIDHGLATTYKKMFGESKELQELAEKSQKVMHINLANREMDWNEFEEILGWMADSYRSPFSTQQMDKKTISDEVAKSQFDVLHMLEDFATYCRAKGNVPAIDLFYEWDKDELYRDKTLKIISILIKEIKKVYAEKIELKDEYSEFFSGDHLVINYNYTKIHDSDFSPKPYYKSENCIYIHGVIVPTTPEDVETDLDTSNHGEIGEIKLGVYKNQISISTNHKTPHPNIDVSKERWEEICGAFERGVGNTNIHFRKENKASPHDKWHALDNTDFSQFSEIIFLGHSMSPNDIDRFSKTAKLKNVKKISIVGYWDNRGDFERFSENVNHFLKNSEIVDDVEVIFINNSKKFLRTMSFRTTGGALDFSKCSSV